MTLKLDLRTKQESPTSREPTTETELRSLAKDKIQQETKRLLRNNFWNGILMLFLPLPIFVTTWILAFGYPFWGSDFLVGFILAGYGLWCRRTHASGVSDMFAHTIASQRMLECVDASDGDVDKFQKIVELYSKELEEWSLEQ